MKNKVLNFLLAMGIPLSSLTTLQSSGCTGVCGNCSFNCTPGIFMLLILAGKFLYQKGRSEVCHHG